VGVEPWTFTFGELAAMARARQMAAWEAVSALLAMTHNVHCTRQSQIRSPEEFHPLRKKRRRLSRQESAAALIAAFVTNPTPK
jgi:hypothetical protein